MNYIVHYHQEIPNDLSSIPVNMRLRIKKAIETRLSADPIKYGDFLRRSLKGYRKMRVGDYRVIYKLQSKNIFILKIGHRKEVYSRIRK
jgi:mRNA interferase RelE/StbE